MRNISRRDFLKGSAAAVAALGLTGLAPAAFADDAAEEKEVLVPGSTVECDAVVVGCGAAGIHAALVLAAGGKKTYLLEKGASCGVSSSVSGCPPASSKPGGACG